MEMLNFNELVENGVYAVKVKENLLFNDIQTKEIFSDEGNAQLIFVAYNTFGDILIFKTDMNEYAALYVNDIEAIKYIE